MSSETYCDFDFDYKPDKCLPFLKNLFLAPAQNTTGDMDFDDRLLDLLVCKAFLTPVLPVSNVSNTEYNECNTLIEEIQKTSGQALPKPLIKHPKTLINLPKTLIKLPKTLIKLPKNKYNKKRKLMTVDPKETKLTPTHDETKITQMVDPNIEETKQETKYNKEDNITKGSIETFAHLIVTELANNKRHKLSTEETKQNLSEEKYANKPEIDINKPETNTNKPETDTNKPETDTNKTRENDTNNQAETDVNPPLTESKLDSHNQPATITNSNTELRLDSTNSNKELDFINQSNLDKESECNKNQTNQITIKQPKYQQELDAEASIKFLPEVNHWVLYHKYWFKNQEHTIRSLVIPDLKHNQLYISPKDLGLVIERQSAMWRLFTNFKHDIHKKFIVTLSNCAQREQKIKSETFLTLEGVSKFLTYGKLKAFPRFAHWISESLVPKTLQYRCADLPTQS